jgi:hypothetical protein
LRAALLASALLLASCRQVAGVSTIAYEAGPNGGDGGNPNGCTNATLVLSSSDSLDLLYVAGGFDIAAVPDENSATGLGYSNLHACSTSTPCTQPAGLLTLGFNDEVMDYAASSSQIAYAIQTNTTTGAGAIHSVGFDGTNDKTLLASASFPSWITSSGSGTFWVSDDQTGDPATLHCIGCNGNTGDQTWISNANLTTTLGAFADASTVYVVADDGTGNGANAIYTCSNATACGANAKVLVKGLQFSALNIKDEVAADGTNVYVTNESSAIASITPAGVQTSIVKGVTTSALAVDGATGDLFYGEENGTVARAKSDGSSAPETLSMCDPGSPDDIVAVAFDSTNVYVALVPVSGNSTVWAIKR